MNPTGMPDPTTQYAQLKSAVLGAQQAGGASPLGNFPELQKLYGDLGSLEPKSQAVAGDVYNTQVQVANQKAAEAAARAAQNDMLDPSKYKQVPISDGGYKFLAPNGQEISANDYSRITGKSLDNILTDSQNPIDMGFKNDYKNLQDFLSAVQNKDTAQVDATIKAQPELDKYRNDLQGLIQRFKDHYPTVFGGTQNGNQAVNSTYIPNASVVGASTGTTIGAQ